MTTAKKLLIEPGHRVLLLGAPSDVSIDLPEGARAAEGGSGPFDVAVSFVARAADVGPRFEEARSALADGGVLWMVHPKKSGAIATDISRDSGWEPLRDAGWAPVTQIASDATWSALRFRHDRALIAAREARGFGAKKTGAKKTGAKKTGAKKTGAKKTGAKKTGAKKSGAKKSGAKKSGAKKSGAKKTGATKTGARRA